MFFSAISFEFYFFLFHISVIIMLIIMHFLFILAVKKHISVSKALSAQLGQEIRRRGVFNWQSSGKQGPLFQK